MKCGIFLPPFNRLPGIQKLISGDSEQKNKNPSLITAPFCATLCSVSALLIGARQCIFSWKVLKLIKLDLQ